MHHFLDAIAEEPSVDSDMEMIGVRENACVLLQICIHSGRGGGGWGGGGFEVLDDRFG